MVESQPPLHQQHFEELEELRRLRHQSEQDTQQISELRQEIQRLREAIRGSASTPTSKASTSSVLPSRPSLENETGAGQVNGGYKCVTRATINFGNGTSKECAVARIRLDRRRGTSREDMLREARLLKLAGQMANGEQHPNILELYHVFEEQDTVLLAMPRISPLGYDLIALASKYQHAGTVMPVNELAAYFLQIVHALEQIHNAGVIHRDIKADQFLVKVGAGQDGADLLQLTDFGLSILISQLEEDPWEGWPYDAGEAMDYHCHELLHRKYPYGVDVDVWGLKNIIDMLGYKQYLLGKAQWHSSFMKEAYDGVSIKDRKQRWTVQQLKCSNWLRRALCNPLDAPSVALPPTHVTDEWEVSDCGVLGKIARFSGRYKAISVELPSDFQPKTLGEMRISGQQWTVLLVKGPDATWESCPNRNTKPGPKSRIIFGIRDKYAIEQEVQLFFDLSQGDLGNAKAMHFLLDLDCFEFKGLFEAYVDGEEAVLGGAECAEKVSEAEGRTIPALDLRARYSLNIAGLAWRKESGGFEVSWLPPPTFIVKPGYIGLVARVPFFPVGRSRRAKEFEQFARQIAPSASQ